MVPKETVKRKAPAHFAKDKKQKNEKHNTTVVKATVEKVETEVATEHHQQGHPVPQKTGNEAKEAHKQQKELSKQRKAQKPNAEFIVELKRLWETARRIDMEKKEREPLIAELTTSMKGRVADVLFKHDASRIVQTCLKYGTKEQRQCIAKELAGKYVQLSSSAYGKFIVTKILTYCPELREEIIAEFYGKVTKLIRHAHASQIVEEAYSTHANAVQRTALLAEFYGPEFSIFKSTEKRTLEDILEQHPSKKPSIMKHLSESISAVMDKGPVGHTILHRALLDYLTHADEAGVQDMISIIKEQIVEMLHTREGSQVAMRTILHATPKDRKAIIKSFKSFVGKICKEEYGHLVMVRLFDVVDDTVLVNKSIISEMEKTLGELCRDKFARRVIGNLLVERSSKYFGKVTIDQLKEADEIRAKTSKKDSSTRHNELRSAISPYLIQLVADKADVLLREPFASQIVSDVLCNANGDKTAAYETICRLSAEDPTNEENIINHIIANRVIRTVVEHKEENEPTTFAPMLLDSIHSHLVEFATSKGGFVVTSLLEHPECQARVAEVLKANINRLTTSALTNKQAAKVLDVLQKI